MIRKAESQDAFAISRVRINAWRATYRGMVPAEFLLQLSDDAVEWSKRTRQALEDGECEGYVAVIEDEIVGFVLYGRELTGDYPSHPYEIYALYMLPAHQGNGIGSALMRQAIDSIHADSGVLVWALELNPYRRFYEKWEAQPIDVKERQFGNMSLTEVAYGWTR